MKMNYSRAAIFVFLASLLLFLMTVGVQPILAQDNLLDELDQIPSDVEEEVPPELPPITCMVEGIGTLFEVTGTDCMNIAIQSVEPLSMYVESMPEMVVMDMEASEGAASTEITLTGFAPLTTYYKYEDDNQTVVEFTTDEYGTHSYTQDLLEGHSVFIQTRPSTIYLTNAGWSDPDVGTWDPFTRTATLTTNLTETIRIYTSQITLDGNGHTLTGNNTGYGVYSYNNNYVTVKNLNIQSFSYGIRVDRARDNAIVNNTTSNNGTGIYLYRSEQCDVTGNEANSNSNTGIYVSGKYHHIEDNTVNSNGEYGIRLRGSTSGVYDADSNTLTNNTANSNGKVGIHLSFAELNTLNNNTANSTLSYQGITISNSSYTLLTGNTASFNRKDGIYVAYSKQCELQNNTFSNNDGSGINLYGYGADSRFYENIISGNGQHGVWAARSDTLYFLGNSISFNSFYGIHVSSCSGTDFIGNTVESNGWEGIYLYRSNSCRVEHNIISDNGETGIYIASYSSNGWVDRNTVSNNMLGILIGGMCNNNFIWRNDFFDNLFYGIQAAVSRYASGNAFDNGSYGNYWSDWTSPDADSDGIVDFPYVFSAGYGQDNFPKAHPYGYLNSPPTANAGQDIQITGADQAYTVIQGEATDPDGNPVEYRWVQVVNGTEQVLLDWTSVGVNGEAYLDLGALAVPLPIGVHLLRLDVRDDGGMSASDGMYLTIENSPPVPKAGDNMQILSVDQSSTVIQGTAMDPDQDPMEYRWLEDTDPFLDWTSVGTNGEAYLDLGTIDYLSLGDHTLTLEVRDVRDGVPGLTASDDMILTVQNSPPEVQKQPDTQTVEVGVDPIVVVAQVLDYDGDTVTYEWLKGTDLLYSGSVEAVIGGTPVAIPDLVVPAGDSRFPLGGHVIEIRVKDGVHEPVGQFVSVEVIDTTAPSLAPITCPLVSILWPPNHTLQPVTVCPGAFDNDLGGSITLDVTVESSEPPDADGDGNTIPDFYIDSVAWDEQTGGAIDLRLRSERSGKGDGRVYTITITATDASGYSSTGTLEVLAPHDKRKK